MLISSIVGVSGADMAFDSLLGGCVAESDLARRCEIMLPEADVTVFGFVPVGAGCWGLTDGLPGGSVH